MFYTALAQCTLDRKILHGGKILYATPARLPNRVDFFPKYDRLGDFRSPCGFVDFWGNFKIIQDFLY